VTQKTSIGRTYDKAILEWISALSIVDYDAEHNDLIEQLETSITNRFYFRVDPILLDWEASVWTKGHAKTGVTRAWQFGTMFIYIGLLAVFAVLLVRTIQAADLPFTEAVKFLNRLPEKALAGETLKTLKEQMWVGSNKRGSDPSYYEKMLKTLPDPIIVIDHEFKIKSYNESSSALINSSRDQSAVGSVIFEVMRMQLKEFAPPKGADPKSLQDLITPYVYSNGSAITNLALVGEHNNKSYWWSLTALRICDDTIEQILSQRDGADGFALVFHDIGEEVGQQKLLEEETEKHKSIISQIFPPQIAEQLLKDRRSLSRTVDLVAVAFCDIVTFTSWCGRETADRVVTALNLMFKKFDDACSRYPTMTKIKCIGDCYMSAAGVFSEAQDAPTAAREMLCFCLDCIDEIESVNQTLGHDLKVRIGISYGGPISAGVLGIQKPVFDIFGETVNQAQKMESSGTPMMVHIERNLYDIVRNEPVVFDEQADGTFLVKKRKALEVDRAIAREGTV
jgi:class 3 adenylate cyclase/PAS domain-containing protein